MRSSATEANGTGYHDFERDRILTIAGFGPGDISSESDLSTMAPFWKALQPYRTSKSGARGWFASHLDSIFDEAVGLWVATTGFINDMISVSPCGHDAATSWALRHHGFSIYALAPMDAIGPAMQRVCAPRLPRSAPPSSNIWSARARNT